MCLIRPEPHGQHVCERRGSDLAGMGASLWK